MKNLTANEMIYRTLTTKLIKEPKYKKELEDLGLVIFDSHWSSMDYWAVKNPVNDRYLVISKDLGNKTRLYKEGISSFTDFAGIKHVNLLNYLIGKRKRYTEPKLVGKYHLLRNKIQSSKYWMKVIEDDIKEVDEKIKRLEEEKKRYIDRYNSYENELNEARKRVDEIKREKRIKENRYK